MRRLLLLAVLPFVALAGPASAAPRPFAGEVRTATTTFQLGGRDGRTWLVGLTLDELRPAGGSVDRSLVLSLRPWAAGRTRTVPCSPTRGYRVRVTDAQGGIADDLGSAFVRLTVAGARLDLSWSATLDKTSQVASVDADEVDVRHAYQGSSGEVAGVVLGPRCATSGEVGGGYVVRRSGPPARAGVTPPAHLPTALVPAHGWIPRCV
jgi:hypothetical protein